MHIFYVAKFTIYPTTRCGLIGEIGGTSCLKPRSIFPTNVTKIIFKENEEGKDSKESKDKKESKDNKERGFKKGSYYD